MQVAVGRKKPQNFIYINLAEDWNLNLVYQNSHQDL